MLRLAIIDNDPTFAGGVVAEAELGRVWRVEPITHRTAPSRRELARLDAILIDPAVVGARFWAYLEEVCGQLPDLSVLICTGKADLASRVRGLRLGADDWITKPASATEILARAEAFRRPRRVKAPGLEEPLFSGEIEIRPEEMDARAGGMPLGLTRREFELLRFLLREEGKVLERATIYRRVWGYTIGFGDRSVYTYIRKLRIKLAEASPRWVYIHTHLGIGYRFEARPAESPLRRIEISPTLPADRTLAKKELVARP